MESKTTSEGSILVAHIGDIHLRDTQYATSQRSGDFFGALLRAITEAVNGGADCLVCTGDNFDVSRPSAKTIGQLMQADALLQKAKRRMFTITGNHDYSSPTWLETLFPDKLRPYGIIPIDGQTVEFEGFKITGVPPYSCKAFKDKAAEIDILTHDSDIVLYHGFVTGIVPTFVGDKEVLDISDMPSSKNIKAVLLGDIHIQGFVQRERPGGGKTLIGYPGSLEMCSKAESVEKSVPLIRVQSDAAIVERTIPLSIRPHISRVVRDESELDALIEEVTAVANQHPVVLVEFDRSLPQTISRLHAVLDAQRALVRCYPLPLVRDAAARVEAALGEEQLDMSHFVSKRFDDNAQLCSVALDLLQRGDYDGQNIVSAFVESRLNSMNVREILD